MIFANIYSPIFSCAWEQHVRCIISILDFKILVFYQNRDWKHVFTQCYDAQARCAHTILLSIFYLTCLYLPCFLSKTCDGNILSATGNAVSLLVNLSTGVCGFWIRKTCLFLFWWNILLLLNILNISQPSCLRIIIPRSCLLVIGFNLELSAC